MYDVILTNERKSKMLETLYNWIIKELNEAGYQEQDIVLVSNCDQSATCKPEVFKQLTNQTYKVDSIIETEHRKLELMIGAGELHIHLSDHSIAIYNSKVPDYGWEVWENNLYIIKSAGALAHVEERISDIQLNIEEVDDTVNYSQNNVQSFFDDKNTLLIKVNLVEGTHPDYCVILHPVGSIIVLLDTKSRVLGLSCNMTLEEEEFQKLISMMGDLPIVYEDKFFDELMSKTNVIIAEDKNEN